MNRFFSFTVVILCIICTVQSCNPDRVIKFTTVKFTPTDDLTYSWRGGCDTLIADGCNYLVEFDNYMTQLPEQHNFWIHVSAYDSSCPDSTLNQEHLYYLALSDSLGVVMTPEPYCGNRTDSYTLSWDWFRMKVTNDRLIISADKNNSSESRSMSMSFGLGFLTAKISVIQSGKTD